MHSSARHTKLLRLEKGTKVHKRPLVRQQQSSSRKTKIIYVSGKTPFMSVISRVRKELDKSCGSNRLTSKNMGLSAKISALKQAGGTQGDSKVVTVMGTGKAIEKTLSVASWFSQQNDCEVAVETKTISTIDDVVPKEDDDGLGDEETRRRNLSCLVVSVTLR